MSGTYSYVTNHLSVFGEDALLDKFVDTVCDVGSGVLFSFDQLRPMPPSEEEQLRETFGENWEGFLPGESAPGWWFWRQQYWGTRWDLTTLDPVEMNRQPGLVSYKFKTAWSSIEPLIQHAAPKFPTLTFELSSYCSQCNVPVGYLRVGQGN